MTTLKAQILNFLTSIGVFGLLDGGTGGEDTEPDDPPTESMNVTFFLLETFGREPTGPFILYTQSLIIFFKDFT